MMRDDKLVRVASRSKQNIERVLWVWGAILESAAEIDDNGRYDFDIQEAAYFLRADESDLQAIMDGLTASRHVDSSVVVKWGDRQFISDRSTSRVADHRKRKRAETAGSETGRNSGNADVTFQKRFGNSPETETETDNTLSKDNDASVDSDAQFWASAKAYIGGRNPGAMIGKWIRDADKTSVAEAITRAQLERPVDRVAFIQGVLRHKRRRTEEAEAYVPIC